MESMTIFQEQGFLEGEYPLKLGDRSPVEPEVFLGLFESKDFYQNARKFVRRVDNDTGIPFLTREEYEVAKHVIPVEIRSYFERNIASVHPDRVYLRGKDYFLNFRERDTEDKRSPGHFGFDLLYESLESDTKLGIVAQSVSQGTQGIDERLVVGSLLDLYKNHLMVLFTGLFEAMKLDPSIPLEHYTLVRSGVEQVIDGYYSFILTGRQPKPFLPFEYLQPVLTQIGSTIQSGSDQQVESSVSTSPKIYDDRKYLSREFDHPGRMVLYAAHLLSQIRGREKRYDLLVNLLNGSAEMGLAIQTIDSILQTDAIRSTTIFEVDFARYSRKDRKDIDLSYYGEFETVALPLQLHSVFRDKIDNKSVLLVDDNLNTGVSLYNVQRALREVASSVDLSTAEVVPLEKVIQMLEQDQPEKDPQSEIKLIESDLAYIPIGLWRDLRRMLKERVFEHVLKQ